MAEDRSSSIISALISGLSHVMPEGEQAKLAAYAPKAAEAGSEKTAEWVRAVKCARWAEQIVSIPEHNHLAVEARRVIEAIRELEKTFGAELAHLMEVPFSSGAGASLSASLGGQSGYPVSPRFEAEIEWVYEAVHVAEKVAAKAGWEAVPWEELLTDMLNVSAA